MTSTKLLRHPERALTQRKEIEAILDEALVAHVGFIDDGAPVVIPTTFARCGNTLYLHGAIGGRLAAALGISSQICVTVTLLDGLVLARSAFHHSMNYRSVIIFGAPRLVTDAAEKRSAFDALVEHVVPGRSADARRPSEGELTATALVALELDRCSAKRRAGPPIDATADAELPVWGGVVPCRLEFGAPQGEGNAPGVALPTYLERYARDEEKS